MRPRFVAEGVSIGLPRDGAVRPGRKVIMSIRPNDLSTAPNGDIHGEVVLSETTGADVQIHVRIAGYDAVAVVPRDQRREPGEPIMLSVHPEKVHLFDAETEERIG